MRWKVENQRKLRSRDKRRFADKEVPLREAFSALDRGDDRG